MAQHICNEYNYWISIFHYLIAYVYVALLPVSRETIHIATIFMHRAQFILQSNVKVKVITIIKR